MTRWRDRHTHRDGKRPASRLRRKGLATAGRPAGPKRRSFVDGEFGDDVDEAIYAFGEGG